jgi:uncharacterized Zn-finger protein
VTNLQTPQSWVLLEKQTVFQPLKKFTWLNGTWGDNTIFTAGHQSFQLWAKWIQVINLTSVIFAGYNFHPVVLSQFIIEHTLEINLICVTCGKRFSHSASMIRHNRIHSGEKSLCEICGKGFSNNASLVRHDRTHTAEESFNCEICGEGFSIGQNFIQHLCMHV